MTTPIHPAYCLNYVDKKKLNWTRISINYGEVARMCTFLTIDPKDHIHQISITENLLKEINKGTKIKLCTNH